MKLQSNSAQALRVGVFAVIVGLVGGSRSCNVEAAEPGLLLSVAFKTNNRFGNSPHMSGPEAAATLANPLFGVANVWNNLHVEWAPPLTKNPSFSNLVDSAGNA